MYCDKHNGKEYECVYMKYIWKERMCVYIYITESLCYTVEINTLQIKYTSIKKFFLKSNAGKFLKFQSLQEKLQWT